MRFQKNKYASKVGSIIKLAGLLLLVALSGCATYGDSGSKSASYNSVSQPAFSERSHYWR